MVGVPTVRDRIAQRACLNVLLPLLDPHLEECSYAYRPGRSIADALRQIENWRNRGHEHLLESDIESCFDSIDRELLLDALARYVPEARLLELVRRWLECGTLWTRETDAEPHDTLPLVASCGIPQGSALSPLLCNLFLDDFDEAVLRQHFKLARYADDFVIVTTREERAEAALQVTRDALGELGLRLHPGKTRLTTFEAGFRYLGTVFVGDLTLPTVRRETVRPDGSMVTRFTSGYPEAPRLRERAPAPAPPSAHGILAVTSAVAQTHATTPVADAFNQALRERQQRQRRQTQREAAAPWPTAYLV